MMKELEGLSQSEKKAVIETQLERNRGGGFKMIFPNENYPYYQKFIGDE